MSSYQKGIKTGLGQMLEKADSFNRILESIDNKINNISNDIGGMGSSIDSSIRDISNNINNMTKAQNDYNAAVENSESSGSKLLGKVKQLAKSVFSLDNAKLAFNATIGGAAKAREQLIGFQNLMGDKEVGKEYLDKISKDSIQKGFSTDDAVNNTRGFMKITKNTDKLDSLNNMAARLATTNPSKGIGDSGAAIQNAMNGKFDDLKNKFNFSDVDTQILKGSKSLGDFIGKMDVLLNKKGLTAENLINFSESPLAQVNQLKNNIDDALSSAGGKALDILTPIIVKFNNAFANGNFEGIFSGIAVALNLVASIALGVADIFSGIGMIIRENWGTIQQILVFAAGMLSAVLIPMLWQKVTAIWANVMALLVEAQAWMLANIQIMLIVGVIFLLIYILIQCGVTFEQIIGFIGGLVGVFFGYLYNKVACIWNIFASFAEFLANLFTNPLYSTKALFVNIWNDIVGFVGRALDAIVGMIKKIPFLGDKIGDFSVVDKLTMDIEEPPKDYIKVPKMEMKNYDNEFSYGYGKGAYIGSKIDSGIADVLNKFSAINKNEDKDILKNWNKNQIDNFKIPDDKLPAQPSMSASNLQNNFNTTNQKLDNVNDSIDVSNEHLEMLRDLAEIESVQNFVALTPTVQVTTGDIKEEADINTIISKIENYMRTELVNSAEGVYV